MLQKILGETCKSYFKSDIKTDEYKTRLNWKDCSHLVCERNECQEEEENKVFIHIQMTLTTSMYNRKNTNNVMYL